jgi:sialate O-acetylesterase
MNIQNVLCPLLASVFALLSTDVAVGEVRLPNALASHMVLQRDAPVRVWGWAEPAEKVSVSCGGQEVQATAGEEGRWEIELPAQSANDQGQSITVTGSNTIELEDVLFGDVWVGSGQSNMAWELSNTIGAEAAVESASHPLIRLFHIPLVQADAPTDDVNAEWRVCDPATVPSFSAVLYYFGLKLQHEANVPIGLINTSWGGSPIEPWTITESGSGGMYNAMVAPITNLSVRGAIWYQGETNIIQKNGFTYLDKMKDLINGWRKAFDHSDMPFYFVQIAPWSGERYEPGELPAVWEAQTATLNLPHTGMAVTTDLVDNIADIHPRNKLDVGNRLARWALAKVYDQKDLIYSGPIYKSVAIDGSNAKVDFHFTGTGLKSRDDKELSEFQIAGEDGEFFDAVAVIDDQSVVVSCDKVAKPTQVRFGWHKVANPNLVNADGLPASPFQTQGWRGMLDAAE